MSMNEENLDSPSEVGGSYGQILHSSALIGGSSLLNVGFGVVRTKAMALLLGPAGFGLFGLYSSISSLAETLAGMGIDASGVRQIAQSSASGDSEKIARSAAVLLRVSLALGMVGTLILILFAQPISMFTFGNGQSARAIRLLSLVALFNVVTNGLRALLQGMRRIYDLARLAIFGTLFGVLVSVPIVYFFREGGVVPAIVCTGLVSLLVACSFTRKIPRTSSGMSGAEQLNEASSLLKLGFVFMSGYLITVGSAYGVRIILLRDLGYAPMGYYQAAWTLGGLYVAFILEAMGADFYPRLTAVADDNTACNRLVNEQTQIGMLLAGPGILITLTVAPFVIPLFYSRQFEAAVAVLRWICCGAFLQVITWPMSYILVAKGKQTLFFICELVWGIASLGLAWIWIHFFGLNGAGMAFAGAYGVYGLLLFTVVGRISRFRWSSANGIAASLFLCLIALVILSFSRLPLLPALGIGVVVTLLSVAYSVRTLTRLVAREHLPGPVRRLLDRLKRFPSGSVNVD